MRSWAGCIHRTQHSELDRDRRLRRDYIVESNTKAGSLCMGSQLCSIVGWTAMQRNRIVKWVSGGSLVWCLTAHAQAPLDFLTCGPSCSEVLPSSLIIDCRDELGRDKLWSSAWGRSWYGPLSNIGPIEISIEARAHPGYERLPLFVEIRTDQGAAQCRSDIGAPTWLIYGTESCHPDSLWSTLPRIDLSWLPLGTTYWVQVVGFLVVNPTPKSSPFVGCVRVRAFPSAIASGSWGQVKQLFRDATR